MRYDLILHGGRVIDPAQPLDGLRDVAVHEGRIAAIAERLPLDAAPNRIDVTGQLVLPGLIDTHAHVYQYVTGRFGMEADLVGVRSGVTTLVDQGGPSCMTLPGFREFVAARAESRVLAFLSAYLVGGLEGHFYPALYRPDCVDVAATVRAARANADLVRGIKAHAEVGGIARWGLEVIRLAARIGRECDLPVYVHFGQLWPLPDGDGAARPAVDPDAILPEVLEVLRPGDVLAHPFTRHPGGFVDTRGRVHPVIREALARGLRVDVGHGSHWSFPMARIALDAGIVPDTLGADIHGYNTAVPRPAGSPEAHPDETHAAAGRFSLASAMTALMACGLPLEQVVPMVTSNAARMVGLDGGLGTLRPSAIADVSVLHDERGRWTLRDGEGHEVAAARRLRPAFCLRAGRRIEADASILPAA